LTVRVYDRMGRVVRQFGQQQLLSGCAAWHGVHDNGSPVSIGMYIILVESEGYSSKHAVVVAR